jgi:hypothetical protein
MYVPWQAKTLGLLPSTFPVIVGFSKVGSLFVGGFTLDATFVIVCVCFYTYGTTIQYRTNRRLVEGLKTWSVELSVIIFPLPSLWPNIPN